MATKTSTRAVDRSDAEHSLDSSKVLTECCQQGTACRFQLVHSGYSAPAIFVPILAQGIELQISSDEMGEPLLPQAICCISFPYRTTFCAFLGCIVDVRQPKSKVRRVIVSVPQQLTTTNLRQSFRVPIIQHSGLETVVRTADNQQFVVDTHDIAQAGLEIEFAEGDPPRLSVGQSLSVELRFRGEVVQRTGDVRRIQGNRCGLLFGQNPDDGDHQQAARMNGIMLSLQQMWLKSRLK